jgi:hypothetical protein
MIRTGIFGRLKPVAFMLMFFPFLYLIILIGFYHLSFIKVIDLYVSFFFLLVLGVVVVSGYGFWKFRRWSWYVFLVGQVLLGVLNLTLIEEVEHPYGWVFPLLFVALQGLLVLRIAKRVRTPFIYPRIRWWENNPKLRGAYAGFIEGSQEKPETVQGDLLDFSEQGCFIKMPVTGFKLEQTVQLHFEAFGQTFRTPAVVVWMAGRTVTHPEGLGLKFYGLSRPQRREFKLAARRVNLIQKFYRRNRYFMNPKDFAQQLRTLEIKPLYTHETKDAIQSKSG